MASRFRLGSSGLEIFDFVLLAKLYFRRVAFEAGDGGGSAVTGV
jgi:hypothetical protein